MIPMVLGITIISFLTLQLAPGSPVELLTDLNPNVSAESAERLRELYNLDEPIHIQYLQWLKRVVSFDFGNSFTPDRRPVIDKIMERMPVTIFISAMTLLITLLIAIPIGLLSASNPYGWFDRLSTLFVFIGFSAPGFWVALLAMIFFGLMLGWLPISGLTSYNHADLNLIGKLVDYSKHLILPILVSALSGLAFLSRLVRQSTLEVIESDFIVCARAKGVPRGLVLFKHSLRNALLPLITTLGMSLPALIGGSAIFETIFSIPGFGQLFLQSVYSRDYPLVMAALVIGSLLTLIGNLLADITYAFADPRISYE